MTDGKDTLRAAYYTLGCKLNFSETSEIGKALERRGILRAAPSEKPDICIVNTCSVTEMADKKGRQLLRRLGREFPEATIVATGCYAQLKPEEVMDIPGVNIVLGNNEKLKADEFIDSWIRERERKVAVTPRNDIREFRGACERGDRTRYFLKVQDGCDYFCTYCTIPYARGRSRSGRIEELVDEARKVASEGGKEIVLTGVNVGCFGLDTGESFIGLLKGLDSVEGIERYRISSIEPNLLTEKTIRWIASGKTHFMPHFHIPLQSGSDRVLRLMNRRYDTALFRNRIELIRELIPDAFIGVDVIAGARGETLDEWEKSREFIESLDITRLHPFPYSERPGTKALLLGDVVPVEERHRRVGELTAISERKTREFEERFIGTVRPVLWESPLTANPERMAGHTDNYFRVTAPVDPALFNTVTPTLLKGYDPDEKETLEGIPQ